MHTDNSGQPLGNALKFAEKPTDSKFIDLDGKVFGRLMVLGFSGKTPRRASLWLCQCECGNRKVIVGQHLRTGKSTSCGCFHREQLRNRSRTHGGSATRLNKIRRKIIDRCCNPSSSSFSDYGGRGIYICDEWRQDFCSFRDWAASAGYAETLTIERIDVNGPYTPENCCWIPRDRQAANQRRTLWIEAFGERKSSGDWVRDARCSIQTHVLWHRIKSGWSPEKAIVTPPRSVKRKGNAA